MSPTLPFRLKVPGKDEVDLIMVSSVSYKFHGFLHLEPDGVRLEWSGTAEVDEVGLASVEERKVPLPAEELFVPFEELRAVRIGGFWRWTYVELTEARLGVLRVVPGEEGGRVRCYVASRDRALARSVAEEMGQQLR